MSNAKRKLDSFSQPENDFAEQAKRFCLRNNDGLKSVATNIHTKQPIEKDAFKSIVTGQQQQQQTSKIHHIGLNPSMLPKMENHSRPVISIKKPLNNHQVNLTYINRQPVCIQMPCNLNKQQNFPIKHQPQLPMANQTFRTQNPNRQLQSPFLPNSKQVATTQLNRIQQHKLLQSTTSLEKCK